MIILKEKDNTPTVFIDQEKGFFSITGNCYPENPNEFFKPIFLLSEKYVTEKKDQSTVIKLKLNYMNTGSCKKISDLLEVFEPMAKYVVVEWYYQKGDDDLFEIGEAFKETSELSIRLIEVNS